MKNNLDSLPEIEKIDVSGVYKSLIALPKQCEDAWKKAGQVVVPENYKNAKNLVMCGMGGSGLGARVIESAFAKQINIPLTRVNDYHLPGYVNEESLVICSSYSGTTEETIQNLEEAVAKKAMIMVIGTGGTLIDKAKELNLPYYQIEPAENPSNQPRMAIGYSIMGQLALLAKAGIIKIEDGEVEKVIKVMTEIIEANKAETVLTSNPSKTLAIELFNRIVILISSEHLVGATHVFNNQINENAKNLSFDFVLPELNHHLMEGLSHPEANGDNLYCFFINSTKYSERNSKRVAVTKDVVGKNNILYSDFMAGSESLLTQVFEVIQFGAFVNFYLSILYKQNPAPIPWVDYFKKKLSD